MRKGFQVVDLKIDTVEVGFGAIFQEILVIDTSEVGSEESRTLSILRCALRPGGNAPTSSSTLAHRYQLRR